MKKRNRDGVILCLGFLALYIITRARVHGMAEDAWMMVIDFTRGGPAVWLHSHHLLYGPLAHYWWQWWDWIGIGDAYRVIQSLNCILGALAVQQGYLLGRDVGLSRWSAFWAAVGFGLTFVCWWLAAEIEVAPLSLLTVLLTVRYLWRVHRRGASVSRALVAAGMVTLAVTAHLFNLSLMLPAVYVLYVSAPQIKPNPEIQYSLKYPSIFLIFVIICVIFVYTAADFLAGTGRGPTGYLVGYFKFPGIIRLTLLAPLLFGVGLVRSLFGVEVLFRFESLAGLLTRIFPGKDFSDESFLARDLSLPVTWLLAAGMLLCATGFAVLLVKVVRGIARLQQADRGAFWFLAVGLAAVILPNMVAGPIMLAAMANNEHFPSFWALLFIAMAFTLDRKESINKADRNVRPTGYLVIVAVTLFLLAAVNGLGSIRLMMNPANDLKAVNFARWVEVVEPQDLLVVHLTEQDAAGLRYMTGAWAINTMHAPRPSDEWLRDWQLENDGRVWIQDVKPEDMDRKYPPVQEFELVRLDDERWKMDDERWKMDDE